MSGYRVFYATLHSDFYIVTPREDGRIGYCRFSIYDNMMSDTNQSASVEKWNRLIKSGKIRLFDNTFTLNGAIVFIRELS